MPLKFYIFGSDNMYKSGLVLEGGGNRAVYTSGVLDAFLEEGIEFPYVVGVSAGSCNGTSFIGKCKGRQHDIIIKHTNDKRYMGVSSLVKGTGFLNLDWIFGELAYDILPLDHEAFEASGTTLCVCATNAETGKAEYFYPKGFREGCEELKASCAMPGVTSGVKIGGVTYFDGGLVDSIPLKKAVDDGCKKTVVILTQHKGYIKEAVSPRTSRMFRKHPKIAELITVRHDMYNDQLRFVEEQREKGLAYVIQPSTPLGVSSLEKDTSKLEAIYQLGYSQGKEHAEKVKEFLK